MKLERAELRIIRLPLLTPFTIATGTMHEKLFPLLILHSGGLEGYAEGVMDPLPDYLDETVTGSVAFLRDVLLPQALGKSFASPAAFAQSMSHWRGFYMARATLEMAFWDLWAKAKSQPLSHVLGGVRTAVEVGVSLGIAAPDVVVARAIAAHEQGYRRIKLKIMPGHDVKLVAAVRQALPSAHLTVDANTAYSLHDVAVLKQLDAFNLDYIEQPLAWDDIHDHATLQNHLATPLCLDECIRSHAHARKAIDSGAARVINIKVGRVGGHWEAKRIHDLCAERRVPVWCGGMLEAGIGRAHNIHLATQANFVKPGDTSSASRYFARDITQEKLEAAHGLMPVPKGLGIGVSLDWPFLDSVTQSREVFTP
jgi:o-succinylbenzoate synthase